MENYSFILLAGGIGTRMKMSTPKQFLLVGGKPMMIHVLEKIDAIPEIKEIIVTAPEEFIDKTIKTIDSFGISTSLHCVSGGKTRQESVYKGLQSASYERVIIHEAVRPFVTKEEFVQLIDCESEAAIYGLDIPFTVVEGHTYVEKNLERDHLVNVQLPQKFNMEQLLSAHETAHKEGRLFTDDASLYFYYLNPMINIIEGSEYNIKITKPVDLKIAEILYKEHILKGE